jgi:hypothetical protein
VADSSTPDSVYNLPHTRGLSKIGPPENVMATPLAPASVSFLHGASVLPGRRYDHLFFSGMAVALLLSVLVGFGPTYYLAGVFSAPLPAPIIHIHAAVFSCWILLLVVQTSLVSAHRMDIHRRLGLFGFGLACVMPVVGVLAATNRLVRNMSPPSMDAKTFYAIPMTDMVIFPVLIYFAYRTRTDSLQHKRLILIATLALMTAAFARFHVAFLRGQPLHASLVPYAFLLCLAVYDLWSTRKLQPATVFGGTFLVVVQQASHLFAHTTAWQSFAAWVQSNARWIG